jgi:hypothetical protein
VPDDQDTGEVPAVEPSRPDEQTMQEYILLELQRIRYRLGVLVVWFVVLPIVAGFIAWIAVSFSD